MYAASLCHLRSLLPIEYYFSQHLCFDQGRSKLDSIQNHLKIKRNLFQRNKTRCQQRIVFTIFFTFLIIFLRLLLPLLETLSGNFSNIFPQFSVYDNPAANHAVAKCRWLTLHYLAARHFLLLFFPHPLCYDWSMGSIPLIHDFSDIRNILTLIFHILLLFFCFIVFRFLTRRDTDERFIEKYLCLEADPSSQMTRNGDSVMRSLNRMTDVNRNDFLIQSK